MGRAKRTKPPRSAPKPAQVAPAEPEVPPVPAWFNEVPPFIALAFVAMALGTIPYGAPMPAWYMWTMAAVGAALALALAADPLKRWRSLTFWPMPVILGAWACSIAACEFPREVLLRSWSMAAYSTVFVAAQVMCWGSRSIKRFALTCLATIVLVACDRWFQAFDSRSLLREVRWPEMRWMGDHWNWNSNTGSMANANDHAVLAVLVPLCLVTLPTKWAWGLAALGLFIASYDAVVVRSRQLLVGLMVSVSTMSILNLPKRARWWVVVTTTAIILLGAFSHPATRSKLMELAQAPLGGRSILIAYGLDLFKHHPIGGIGPSLYGHYYVLGVRDGWTFCGETLADTGTPWVHCLPVEIACEMGVLGLAAYAVVLWVFAGRLREAVVHVGPRRDFGVAVIAAVLAMGAMSLVDLTFIKDWVRICWWLLLGLGFAAPTLPRAQDKPKTATIPDANGL
jgi:hypothetical protein